LAIKIDLCIETRIGHFISLNRTAIAICELYDTPNEVRVERWCGRNDPN
jgi:hypothetical protein